METYTHQEFVWTGGLDGVGEGTSVLAGVYDVTEADYELTEEGELSFYGGIVHIAITATWDMTYDGLVDGVEGTAEITGVSEVEFSVDFDAAYGGLKPRRIQGTPHN